MQIEINLVELFFNHGFGHKKPTIAAIIVMRPIGPAQCPGNQQNNKSQKACDQA